MRTLPELFVNNRTWSAARLAEDPAYFERLCRLQAPRGLWIGCADSRVPANQILGLAPGEIFVHRNVANVVAPGDGNALAVLQYAVEVLRVGHVIVCGHYGCGGVAAALDGTRFGAPLDDWIGHVRAVRDAAAAELAGLPDREARWRRLCELNVAAQVRAVAATAIVREAQRRGQALILHAWIYDLRDGLLRDLDLGADGAAGAAAPGG